MDRLSNVTIFTGDVPGMKRFYESLGLVAREDSPEWVGFDTAGATLGLRAMPDPGRRGIQLQFATEDIEAWVRTLEGAGVTVDNPGIARLPWGKMASLRDPEHNHLTLWEPAQRPETGSGLTLSAAINCRDLAAMKRFYRDALGFPTVIDSAWWVGLSVGDAGLGLHPRMERPGLETHHGRSITIGLAVPDLTAWHEEAVARGVAFTTPPSDRGFGVFADATDPDGNPITFRDVPETSAAPETAETLEEQLAEPYEDDAAPRRAAIRKPVKKGVAAMSRLMVKPRHKAAKPPATRTRRAKPVERVASPRGTGPAGARQKPKRKHDPKRARTKPAIGRLRKAERRTFKAQKQAMAGASKRKPVKRASRPRLAKRAAGRRTAMR